MYRPVEPVSKVGPGIKQKLEQMGRPSALSMMSLQQDSRTLFLLMPGQPHLMVAYGDRPEAGCTLILCHVDASSPWRLQGQLQATNSTSWPALAGCPVLQSVTCTWVYCHCSACVCMAVPHHHETWSNSYIFFLPHTHYRTRLPNPLSCTMQSSFGNAGIPSLVSLSSNTSPFSGCVF